MNAAASLPATRLPQRFVRHQDEQAPCQLVPSERPDESDGVPHQVPADGQRPRRDRSI